ncbi:extensin-like [Lolium rigidum]|uniref:extensin-like n=1 Tax=Lolium rigidum TaxID=89674 RepID=UPI001F5D7042|nr:extensin-like [Lolium rigidum]
MAGPWKKPLWGGPLTLEKYHRFFVDPWGASITNDQLNHIISMHGFVKLPPNKEQKKMMDQLVGHTDLQPPRRSTLHSAAPAARPSAVSIAPAQVAADVDAIGWTECPIGSVAAFAGFGEGAPERLEPMPPPAHHVLELVVRRARSKRTRGSAYPRRAAALEEAVMEEVMELEEADISQPPPSPPPLWMRSPTPPPPSPSPTRPQTAAVLSPPSLPCAVQPSLSSPPGFSSPPPPGFGSPPPPGFSSPPPPGFSSPPPPGFGSHPPPRWHQPTLAPLPIPPPGFGSPQVTPPLPQPSWGLPAGPPPFCQQPVPPSYPAPCWGAPSVLPPQHAAWGWPHPPPRWAPPHMLEQQRPPPPWGFMEPSVPYPMPLQHQPYFEGHQWPQPPWGYMEPSVPPPMPLQHQPHFEGHQWPQPPGVSWPVF